MTKSLPKRIAAAIEKVDGGEIVLASRDLTGTDLCEDGEKVRVGIYVLEQERDVHLTAVSSLVREHRK